MSSLSFDRAAAIYDGTRELPAEISERVTQTILGLAPPSRPILEAGVRTGRIAVPLIRSGAPLVGVDLSLDMMQRLRAKHSAALLARADASSLPFPDATFGAVLTVHVLHLVGPWREALREFSASCSLAASISTRRTIGARTPPTYGCVNSGARWSKHAAAPGAVPASRIAKS